MKSKVKKEKPVRKPVRDRRYITFKVKIGYEGWERYDRLRAIKDMVEVIKSLEVFRPLYYSSVESVERVKENEEVLV